MIDWYLNIHPIHLPFVTLLLCVGVYIGNLLFWFVIFKTMKQIMIGMEINTRQFFYKRHNCREMKEVFLTFMHVPGYSILWTIRWLISQWLFHIGKALKPLNK